MTDFQEDMAISEIGKIDLHAHSRASDGSLTPTELVAEAKKAGLTFLALTDHDTVEGLPEFFEAAQNHGLEVMGGVEISLEHPATVHLLGYNAAGGSAIPAALERLKDFRSGRNRIMLDRLNSLGYDITWPRLEEISAGGQMGRPHFAAALMEKGYFQKSQDVFNQLLAKGRPGYVDKLRLSPQDGLAMVREAGWVPVLAHPVSVELSPEDWPDYLAQLVDWGLMGLEVYHPNLNADHTAFFQKLADRFNLITTAGSDFHGTPKPSIHLDWTIKNSGLGREVLDRLRKALPTRAE